MGIIESAFLGIVQGLTEFIPVSSSGHLYFLPFWMGFQTPTTSFILAVQIGTLLALLNYFRKKLQKILVSFFKAIRRKKLKFQDKQNIKILANVFIATIPALFLGLIVNSILENFYDSAISNTSYVYLVVAIPMILIGVIFIFDKQLFKKNKKKIDEITSKDALIIGFLQTFAFIRGVSRSGVTLVAGQANGMNRAAAAEFSFLMSIPITFLTSLLGIYNIMKTNTGIDLITLFIGIVLSFLAAVFAINFLLKYVKSRDLKIFGIYRILVGFVLILIFLNSSTN